MREPTEQPTKNSEKELLSEVSGDQVAVTVHRHAGKVNPDDGSEPQDMFGLSFEVEGHGVQTHAMLTSGDIEAIGVACLEAVGWDIYPEGHPSEGEGEEEE